MKGAEMEQRQEQAAKKVKTLIGRVVSDKMDKTVTVRIERLVPHPLYKKHVRRWTKLMAHDEENACREGDLVEIAPCRPISRHKSWRVVRIVERQERVGEPQGESEE